MSYTETGWMVVALVATGLGYDLLKRWIGNAPPKEVAALRAENATLKNDLLEFRTLFDGVCAQWRSKVIELDLKCDSVVKNAKNEIAGSLATVSDITKKGWR